MSLNKCPDCGHSVSDSALACPNCGRPNPQGVREHAEAQSQAQGVEFWKNLGVLIVLFAVIYGAFYWYSNRTIVAGPMPVAEAIAADLRGVTLLRVIVDDYDSAERSNAAKAGTVWGTHTSLRIRGYRGDLEIQDRYGVPFGGVKDGERWVK